MMKISRLAATCLVAMITASSASAQNISFGQQEYLSSCAQCHGPEGKGDGYLVAFFSEVGSADLTGLQKANGGVFPVSKVYETISGDAKSRIHGDRQMPLWGKRYSLEAEDMFGPNFDVSPEYREQIVRGRILALIEYISTLQVE